MDDIDFKKKYGMTKAEFDQKYEVILGSITEIQKAIASLAEIAGEHYGNVYKMADEVVEIKKRWEVDLQKFFEKMRAMEMTDVVKSAETYTGAKNVMLDVLHSKMAEKRDSEGDKIVKALCRGDISGIQATDLVRKLLRKERGDEYVS